MLLTMVHFKPKNLRHETAHGILSLIWKVSSDICGLFFPPYLQIPTGLTVHIT